jgi:hypothetical protein
MDRATDGECRWWGMPTDLNDLTKEAIALAVDRGRMLDRGDGVCLTDAGRDQAWQFGALAADPPRQRIAISSSADEPPPIAAACSGV